MAKDAGLAARSGSLNPLIDEEEARLDGAAERATISGSLNRSVDD